MEPYQQRVINEKAELDARIQKLNAFLSTARSDVSIKDIELLLAQVFPMNAYSQILGIRMRRFEAIQECN